MIGRRAGLRWFLALLAAMMAGCARTDTHPTGGRPIPADRVLDFATLYARNCAGCHGADGQFGPAPPLDDPLFLAIVPDEILHRVVAEGRPGTPMPAFSRKHGGPLTDEQVRAIAGGIKSHWSAKRPETPPPAYPVADGHGRAIAGRAGDKAFARAWCPVPRRRGAAAAKDEVGPIHDRAFLALISDQAIRRTIITGRRDLGMPDFAGKDGRAADFQPMTPADVADLVELIADWRRTPDAQRTP